MISLIVPVRQGRVLKKRPIIWGISAMKIKATPYYENRQLAKLANLPYNLTHIRKETPGMPQGLTLQTEPSPSSTIVDADQESAANVRKHFLDEE